MCKKCMNKKEYRNKSIVIVKGTDMKPQITTSIRLVVDFSYLN